jgi:hypothetical protein
MSQSGTASSGGSGGSGITTVDVDNGGSVTGSTIKLYANSGSANAGSSVNFVAASPTEIDFQTTDANGNVFIGTNSGTTSVTGAHNVGLGFGSLNSVTTDFQNIGIGYNTLFNASGGDRNTAIGSYSLVELVNGTNNIAIGYYSGLGYESNESGNILIGAPGNLGESNITYIGFQNTGPTQQGCYIDGITVSDPIVNLTTPYLTYIDSSYGQLAASASLITAPSVSSSSSLSVGTAYHNTSGHDVMVAVYLSVTAATTASIKLGVGTSSTPTQQTIISGLSTAALIIIPINIYIPHNYYALLSTTGTITDSISGQITMPI